MKGESKVNLQPRTEHHTLLQASKVAQSIRVRGVVQGVGFRPFVFRAARACGIHGWVRNDGEGVQIHAEGPEDAVSAFTRQLVIGAPSAATVASVVTEAAGPAGYDDFRILESERAPAPTARISPDLPMCDECRSELLDPSDRRFSYAYINCTNCGPRYSIILALPYDRQQTTMAGWLMCAPCAAEYADPGNRRFHAQPNACPDCGPSYTLQLASGDIISRGAAAIREAAGLLRDGKIVAIKGIGGYHLACDAGCAEAVTALRERKFRKEQPFAVMVRDIVVARDTVALSDESEQMLLSIARPIVIAEGRIVLTGVAPGSSELGVMLPYTPLHEILFASGAPHRLVMTSANRSSEPIAYREDDALHRLAGIADAFLVGERPIARRVDDSVARSSTSGPAIIRLSRGYAPGVVARIPLEQTTLAVGGDLKSTITLVIAGDAIMSQHLGDLGHYAAMESFRETIADLIAMYAVDTSILRVAHDLHPQYASTAHALGLSCASRHAIQHHRAHVASVLAERGAFEQRVLGVAFDGTGYGDDGTIWGGEFFAGSIAEGLVRVGHLREAKLPGGDAAARYPIQSAAGYLAELGAQFGGGMTGPPFNFPERFSIAGELVKKNLRCFSTSSAGRLFDCVAALLGFDREMTFEAQAAIWLEQLARSASSAKALPVPFSAGVLDFRPALAAIVENRRRGRSCAELARGFHMGLARGISDAIDALSEEHGLDIAVLSGGVFQNDLLLSDVLRERGEGRIRTWTNRQVPRNDGGLSLGQAAMTLGEQ